MSDSALNTLDKLEAMLDKARRHSADACRAIDQDAQNEARAIIARAHKDARAKVHATIQHERQSGKTGLDKVRARIDTDRRQKLQEKEHAFLLEAWTRLEDALTACWHDYADRQAWIANVMARCNENLQPGTWVIEHPSDLNTAEMDAHVDNIRETCGCQPEFKVNPDLHAGLIVEVGDAFFDASTAGLLTDRDHISALLLAEMFDHLEHETADTRRGGETA